MKQLTYKTNGTCSQYINIELEDDIIKNVEFIGGCHGNTQGVASLVKGMSADEVIKRLKGIDCHETRYNPRADFQSELYGLSLDEIYALGKKEKRYLINFVKDKRDRFYYKDFGKDKYDRVLGVLYLDKKINVNKMLLDEGVCPVYVARKK